MQGKDICIYSKCTGCFACANICPKSCIFLKEDDYGEIHPIVDEAICIDCKMCQRTCPNNETLNYNYPSHCYAAWITDTEKRKICASGGIGTEFFEYTIRHGGIVFGSRYDENLNPIITWTKTIDDLDYFKGSRYVQSRVGEKTFKEVKDFLLKGSLVLYIGTPCQIAGLYGFLNKEYDNLITVDLICHGVSPMTYLKQEVKYLVDKYRIKDISDIRFRGNDGNNFRLTLWNKARRKLFPRSNYRQKIFAKDFFEDYYLKGFLKGISLRENCYTCNYARPNRISDLTIGDFIGLGKETLFNYPKENVSSITTNTQKGYEFLMNIAKTSSDLRLVERNYKERLEYRPSLMEPFKRDSRNEKFRILYKQVGFPLAIREVLRKEINIEYHSFLLKRYRPDQIMKEGIKKVIGAERISDIKKFIRRMRIWQQ